MNWTEWFLQQLQASAEGLEWGFWQVPERHRTALPPDSRTLGEWPALRHIWHVTEYERCLALPSMRQWLGEARPADDAWLDDDETWRINSGTSAHVLIERFWEVRRQELALIQILRDTDWNECRETGWGLKPLSWVVTKTYQHTLEHADTLLRMGLWWDFILEQIALAQDRA